MAQARQSLNRRETQIAVERASEQHQEAVSVSLAMDFLTKLGRLDFDSAIALLHEDSVIDLPYAGAGITVKGRNDILAFLRKSMGAKGVRIDYRLEHAYPGKDENTVVLEISTNGASASGKVFTNRLVAIFRFRDGKIELFREYFNPLSGA
jgi:ketosteroid isomerase-like protein